MKLQHICEVCGITETLTPEEAFEAGWDYPPRMGEFGVLSPRTCGDCGIETTLWFRLISQKADLNDLSEKDLALVERIHAEPDSIKAE